MDEILQDLIDDLKKKRKIKKTVENVSVFTVLIMLFIIVYLINAYYSNDLIFMLLFFLAGSICFFTATKNIINQYKIKKWIIIDCTIIKKELLKKDDFISAFMTQSVVPIIYYSYSINDNIFVSDKVHVGVHSSTDKKKWDRISENYKMNHKAKCYLNPKNNNQAVLESFIDWDYSRFYFFFGLFFWGFIIYYLLSLQKN